MTQTQAYLFLAFAPSLWLLLLGRAIAGLTSANVSVATAYITDISPEQSRARRFGLLNAMFGAGFIIGPILGGALGDYWLRLPFIAAAALNTANLALALALLPETRRAAAATEAHGLSPFSHFRWLFGFRTLLALVGAYFIIALVGEIGGTVWVLYGTDKFHWSPMTTGISLAAFGLFHAVTQAFIAGPVSERWGERRTVAISIVTDSAAYIAIALATKGWMAFLLMPLFSLGGIGAPALQSLLTAHIGTAEQGRLQGLLSSIASLATIIGPLLISTVYFASRQSFPGLVWLLGAGFYLLCLPAVFMRNQPEQAA